MRVRNRSEVILTTKSPRDSKHCQVKSRNSCKHCKLQKGLTIRLIILVLETVSCLRLTLKRHFLLKMFNKTLNKTIITKVTNAAVTILNIIMDRRKPHGYQDTPRRRNQSDLQ